MDNNDFEKAISDSAFQRAEFIWNEYKYRHEHIWKLIFQITSAVVAVSILPYLLTGDVGESVGYFVVALPLIGLALTILCTLRINRECDILAKVKGKHRTFHTSKYGIVYDEKESSFRKHLFVYFISLIILGTLNVVVVAMNAFGCS